METWWIYTSKTDHGEPTGKHLSPRFFYIWQRLKAFVTQLKPCQSPSWEVDRGGGHQASSHRKMLKLFPLQLLPTSSYLPPLAPASFSTHISVRSCTYRRGWMPIVQADNPWKNILVSTFNEGQKVAITLFSGKKLFFFICLVLHIHWQWDRDIECFAKNFQDN